jgi:hypothetical protein
MKLTDYSNKKTTTNSKLAQLPLSSITSVFSFVLFLSCLTDFVPRSATAQGSQTLAIIVKMTQQHKII